MARRHTPTPTPTPTATPTPTPAPTPTPTPTPTPAASPKPFLTGNIHLLGGNQVVAGNPSQGKAWVDGYRGRYSWGIIQPVNAATYDWTKIDADIAACNTSGKKLSVSVAAGVSSPITWLTTAGVAMITVDTGGGVTLPMPLSFDPVYQAKWDAFIAAFGARYDGNPTVANVFFSGLGQQTLEYHVTNTTANTTAWNAAAVAAGYADKSAALRAASTHFVDKFVTAFPHTPTMFTAGNPWSGGEGADDTNFIQDYVTAKPDHLRGLCSSFLHAAVTHTNVLPVLLAYPKGDQAIYASTDHGRFYSPNLPDRVYTDGVFNASTTITSATANFSTGRDAGHSITGTGIPAAATIVTVNSTTSITISVATTTSGSAKTVTVIDQPGLPTAIYDLLQNGAEKGDQYVEIYAYDLAPTGNPTVNDATLIAQRLKLKANAP